MGGPPRNLARTLAAMVLAAAAAAAVRAQTNALLTPAYDPLRIPASAVPAALDPAARSSLATHLAGYVQTLTNKTPETLRWLNRAIPMALALDGNNKAAYVLNARLSRNEAFLPARSADPTLFSSNVVAALQPLLASTNSAVGPFAALLLDLAVAADPANTDAAFELEKLRAAGFSPDWTALGPAASAAGGPTSRPAGPIAPAVAEGYRSEPRKPARGQSKINGLVVLELGGGNSAGAPMEIIATAESTSATAPATLSATVGALMRNSFHEALRAVNVRYPVLDNHRPVAVTFDRQYQPKDGPSAATAFGLLLLSMYDNIDLDPKCAATGDLSADWKTRAVGGITGKIRGAARKGIEIVIVPAENTAAVEDMAVAGEGATLWNVQVFSAATLSEALEIARTDRDPRLASAMDQFREIQEGIRARRYMPEMSSPAFRAALSGVLDGCTNHLTASILHRMQTGRWNARFSLKGSAERLLGACEPFFDALESGNAQVADVSAADCAATRERLEAISLRIDPRLRNLRDGLLKMVTEWESAAKRSSPSGQQIKDINSAVAKLGAELKATFGNEKIREELMD